MRPLCALYALLLTFFSYSQIVSPRKCVSERDMEEIKSNPKLLQEYNKFEKLIKDYKKKYSASSANQRLIDPNGLITIPVVFHVIHFPEDALNTLTNISLAQIQSQIDVLNEDFSRTNADAANTPIPFQSKAANVQIAFRLACFDPNGAATDGVTRTNKPRYVNYWENNMKNAASGHEAWPTDRYLNIWVIPSFGINGNLAQTQPIGLLSTSPNTDGIAVCSDCVGRGAGYIFKVYDLNGIPRKWVYDRGRTLTHEIGHWLNLIHIWGPNNGGDFQNCSDSDECDDTPNQERPTDWPYSFPTFPKISCNNGPNGDMWMNFMDYSTDQEMNTFTNDQKSRMRAMFQPGGPRQGFIDNYFKLTKLFSDCSLGYYLLRTPFCEVNGNITWNITGPSTASTYPSTFKTVYPQSGANGTAILSASWNNFVSEIAIPVGYGTESSTYTTYDSYSSGSPVLTLTNGGFYSAKTNTYGTLSFNGANGVAKNWRIFSQSGQAYLNGNGNNFSLFVYPNSNVTIRADIPTTCNGDKMVQFTFYRSGYQYALSPNPASNNITITALNVSADPNARTASEMPEYEVQIFTRYNQLMKKTKCAKGSKDITIDVSSLPSNQLYTVQLITSEEVQTKSFFKE
jgi:hypothetical protein